MNSTDDEAGGAADGGERGLSLAAVRRLIDLGTTPMALCLGPELRVTANAAWRAAMGLPDRETEGARLTDMPLPQWQGALAAAQALIARRDGAATAQEPPQHGAAAEGDHMRLDALPDGEGGVAGVLLSLVPPGADTRCPEDAGGGEPDRAFLDGLSDALRALADPAAMEGEACRRIARHFGLDRAFFVAFDPASEAAIALQDFSPPGAPSLVGTRHVGRLGCLAAVLRQGRTVVHADLLRAGAVQDAEAAAALGMGACLGVPVIRDGRTQGALCLATRGPRPWCDRTVAVARDAAERLWSAVERSRVETALRRVDADFRMVAETVPAIVWIADEAGRNVYMNRRWSELVGADGWPETVEDLVARHVHPDDVAPMRQTLAQALETGQFELEYRIRTASGGYRWLLARAEALRDPDGGAILRWYGAATDIHERVLAEKGNADARTLLETVIGGVESKIYAKDRAGRFIMVNDALAQLIGTPREAMLGRTDADFMPPATAEQVQANDRAIMRTGKSRTVEETMPGPDGGERTFLSVKSPLRGADGDILGIVGVTTEITDRKRAEQRQALLMAELDHRVKNMLAVVQSIARLSLRGIGEAGTVAAEDLIGRIHALSQSYEILMANQLVGVRFRDLVQSAVAAFGEPGRTGAVRFDGPDLMVGPKAVQTLTLALHELVTNAAKYGALSRDGGRVALSWQVAQDDGDRRIVLSWIEAGGPAIETPPRRRGFGTTLLEGMVRAELGGTAMLDYARDGLRAEFRLPLARVAVPEARVAPGAAGASRQRADRPQEEPGSLQGVRVLVVEDEYLIGLEIEQALASAGCRVAGPAVTVASALELAAGPVDIGVLDLNVDGAVCWDIARHLAARSVPFVVVSGYAERVEPPPGLTVPARLEKPLRQNDLLDVLRRLLGGPKG